MSKVKIGDKYIIPSGTELWFSQLLQKYITTKDYVIVVTHTTTDDKVIYGDLHEVTFPITIPGLRKIIRGATSVNIDQVKPIGDLLEPKMWDFKYKGKDD